MMRVLAWKEMQEQRVVWVALLALLLFMLLGLPLALRLEGMEELDRPDFRTVLFAALIAAGVHGLVCGAMLLAGEREEGTLGFLDAVAGRRGGVWLRKLVTGLGFTLVLALAAGAVAAAFGPTQFDWPRWKWLIVLPAMALDAFAWGLLGSALGRSVLAASGLGGLFLGLSWLVTSPFLVEAQTLTPFLIARTGLALLALGCSALIFCRHDLSRGPALALPTRLDRVAGVRGWRSLQWLLWRQARWEVLVLGFVAFAVGLFLSADLLGLWALGTLLFGVLCGTGMFAGEQRGGYARFLGDQRLPAGRIWLAKLFAYAMSALMLAFFMALGGLLSIASTQRLTGSGRWGSGPEAEILHMTLGITGLGPLVLLWLVHGFAAGQFCGMIFHKGIVAVVLAAIFGALSALLWVPSLLAGGVEFWQILALPLLLVLATRLAVWAWTTDGLSARRPVLVLSACLAAAVLSTGAGLAYRVLEVPASAAPFDLLAYRASLPKADENRAGELINRACRGVVETVKEADQAIGFPATWVPPGGPGRGGQEIPPQRDRFSYNFYAHHAIEAGLPAGVPEFERWLDRVFAGEWFQQVSEAGPLPLGVVLPPAVYLSGSLQIGELGGGLGYIRNLLFAQTLQLQKRGDQAGALDQIVLMLALSRHLRHHALALSWLNAYAFERDALTALEGWLRGGPDAALVRKALAELQAHERATPPVAESIQVEYLVARHLLDDPLSAFAQYRLWNRQGQASVEGKIQVLAWSHAVPWERMRMRRLLDAIHAGRLRALQESPGQWNLWRLNPVDWSPPAGAQADETKQRIALGEFMMSSWVEVFAPSYHVGVLYSATLSRCRVAAAQLQAALVLYQLEHGKPAERLADLVPDYLPRLPSDPFSGGTFSYRVSPGEKLLWRYYDTNEERRYREVPAGEGILWSPGSDGQDSGGVVQGLGLNEGFRYVPAYPADLIFLVPRVGARD